MTGADSQDLRRVFVKMAYVASGSTDKGDDLHVGSSASRWGAVLSFTLVFMISYIDRQLLAITVDPVKASLGVGDTEIGLLQGVLFTTVLMVAAIPMAYLVDHFNRIRVLLGCMAVWSLATFYCGFATSFAEFLIGRIGLAIAEAVVPMAAMSVIGDLFPRRKVGQAAAVFMNGNYFGNGAAMLMGGWLLTVLEPFRGQPFPIIETFEPWRGLFFIAASLSLTVAIGLLIFLKEPPRRELQKTVEKVESASFWSFVKNNRGYILKYCLFAGCITTIGYSLYAWPATLLIRVHGMSPMEVGLFMGPMFVLTAVPGTALIAWLSSRCKPERALQHLMLVMIGLVVLLGPLLVLVSLSSKYVAMIALAVVLLVYAALHGAILTPMQLIAPNRMRGRLAAVSSLIWATPASMGPVIIGLLTDRVFKDPLALGDAMAVTLGSACALGVLAGVFAWREAKAFEGVGEMEPVSPVDGPRHGGQQAERLGA